MAGHKYIKKVRLPSGKWRYYYKGDSVTVPASEIGPIQNIANSWYHSVNHNPNTGPGGMETTWTGESSYQYLLNSHTHYQGLHSPHKKKKNVGAGGKRGSYRNAVKANSVSKTKEASAGKSFVSRILNGGNKRKSASRIRPHKTVMYDLHSRGGSKNSGFAGNKVKGTCR